MRPLRYFLDLPHLNRYPLDEYLFGKIPTQDSGFLTEIDAYLAKFPGWSPHPASVGPPRRPHVRSHP